MSVLSRRQQKAAAEAALATASPTVRAVVVDPIMQAVEHKATAVVLTVGVDRGVEADSGVSLIEVRD